MFAIVDYKGNQYKIEPNKQYRIDKIDQAEKRLVFSQVLIYSDEKETLVGKPYLEQAFVEAEIIDQINDKKVPVVKFHSKKRYKRIGNHRAKITLIKAIKINLKAPLKKKALSVPKKVIKKNEKQ